MGMSGQVHGHKECLTNTCCGNASINEKLKLVVTKKALKPKPLKGSKANCIPVHYNNHKEEWMDSNIFLKFIPHAF
jgi:hypothetical protein